MIRKWVLAVVLILVSGSVLAWNGALGLENGLSHLQVRALIDFEHDPAMDEQGPPAVKRYHAREAPREVHPATYLYTFHDDWLTELQATYKGKYARAEAERIRDLYGPPNTHETITLESGTDADFYVYMPHNFNLIRMADKIELTEVDDESGTMNSLVVDYAFSPQ
ncbi:hypothetical protein RN347_08575 [Halomonas sp. PAMB 3264]|uniref:hypothetical protein n=1 Tax=Halomonas sp. PAMB 3264 TaxID=3075222 RepID=UPI002898B047|nr:hypothetical protein [Halomonas sp. PAMB 3264]WNL40704.1 hypothetical protein RN347_08575 [Halomonas sp. PAMB 3264]